MNSDPFKVHLVNEKQVLEIYIFDGENKTDEEGIIHTEDIIYIDDKIEIIKLKILKVLKRELSFEDLYLFFKQEEMLDSIDIYNLLSSGKPNIMIPKNKVITYLSNLDGIEEILSSLPDLDFFSYSDILGLGLSNHVIIQQKPMGISLLGSKKSFIFSTNPFNIIPTQNTLDDENHLITSANTNLLLNYLPLQNNTIFLCLATDVLEATKEKNLPFENIIKIYYPFLYSESIFSFETYEQKNNSLVEKSKQILQNELFKDALKINSFLHEISLLSSIQNEGIVQSTIIMYPKAKINISLNIIFKLLQSDEIVPLIKYNPGMRKEKIYRIYAPTISSEGNHIPFLTKTKIIKLSKIIGKNKMVSLYYPLANIYGNIELIINIIQDGRVQIDFSIKGNGINIKTLEQLLQDTVNPILIKIHNYLAQSGYSFPLFTSFDDKNIVIKDLDYKYIFNEDLNFNSNNCISQAFVIIPTPQKQKLDIIYKKVAYFNELESIEASIIKYYKSQLNISSILNQLSENYPNLSIQELKDKITTFLSNIQTEQDMFDQRKLKIRVSPGFPINLSILEGKIIVNVSGIDNLHYIDCIGTYLKAISSMSKIESLPIDFQDQYNTLCIKNTKIDKDKESEIIIAEAPLPIAPVAYTNKSELDLLLNQDNIEEDEEDDDDEESEKEKDDNIDDDIEEDENEEKESKEEQENIERIKSQLVTQDLFSLDDLLNIDVEEYGDENDNLETIIDKEEDDYEEKDYDDDDNLDREKDEEKQDIDPWEQMDNDEDLWNMEQNDDSSPPLIDENNDENIDSVKENKLENLDVWDQENEEDDEEDLFNIAGGGKTPNMKNWIGTRLRETNYFQKRLQDRDPELFLKKDEGKYSAYSRLCLSNLRRQPVAINDEEKAYIDKYHRNAYTTSITYGSTPENRQHYICPRYWCIPKNVPLTQEDVDNGECGGKVIDFSANQITEDSGYIYEFKARQGEHTDKKGNYHLHAPGFTKIDTHPKNLCIPCCFKIPKNDPKFWPNKAQKDRIEECEKKNNVSNREQTPRTNINVKLNYIISSERFPLKKGRWGYLPLILQRFFQFDNKICTNPDDTKLLKTGVTCILRKGVENSNLQSFLACMTDLYSKMNDQEISIHQFKQILVNAITLERFLSVQNGNLLLDFEDSKNNFDEEEGYEFITKYKTDPLVEKFLKSKSKNQRFIIRAIKSFERFQEYLLSDDYIDYTYLWDLICDPNPKLFTLGLNLVVIKIPQDDLTSNVEIICPTNSYSKNNFILTKPTFIVMQKDKIMEPIYLLKGGEEDYTSVYTFPYDSYPEAIKRLLGAIKKIYTNKCSVLPGNIYSNYTFVNNISLNEVIELLKNLNYIIHIQIINFDSKCIGLIISSSYENNLFYIPVYPSGLKLDIPFELIENKEFGITYAETLSELKILSELSNQKIKCLPSFKILNDGLIVGILTETNQFIPINPPILREDLIGDSLPIISEDNRFLIDEAVLNSGKKEDEELKEVKNVKLETQFYAAFRNSVRSLLNKTLFSKERQMIEKLINQKMSYRKKLNEMVIILKKIFMNYVEFSEFSEEVLLKIPFVSTCLENEENTCNKDTNLFCLFTDDNCKLLIPELNLISKSDNKKIYPFRLADELIRYRQIRTFMLQNNTFLSLQDIDYNLSPFEILLLESQLLLDFIDDTNSITLNKYIRNVSYDYSNPTLGKKYDDKVDLIDLYNEKKKETVKNDICIIKDEPITRKKKWRRLGLMNVDTMERVYKKSIECGYKCMSDIIFDYTDKVMDEKNIKQILSEKYKSYDERDILKIINILRIEKKKKLMNILVNDEISLHELVLTKGYYLTEIDIWNLCVSLNLPIVLLSGNENGIYQNNSDSLVLLGKTSERYYFLNQLTYLDNTPCTFSIYHPPDELGFTNKNIPQRMQEKIEDSLNPSLQEYLNKSTIKIPLKKKKIKVVIPNLTVGERNE